MRLRAHRALIALLALGNVMALPTHLEPAASSSPKVLLDPPAASRPFAIERPLPPNQSNDLSALSPSDLLFNLQNLDSATCTDQEVDCGFLRSASYNLQNEDDDCIRIASHFELGGSGGGSGVIKPLAQDDTTVVFGITSDAQPTSAWCNDIGWALRRIYSSCRRGVKCYGGNLAAARNPEFLVAVGPRVEGAPQTR